VLAGLIACINWSSFLQRNMILCVVAAHQTPAFRSCIGTRTAAEISQCQCLLFWLFIFIFNVNHTCPKKQMLIVSFFFRHLTCYSEFLSWPLYSSTWHCWCSVFFTKLF